jgi:hypothetical protein
MKVQENPIIGQIIYSLWKELSDYEFRFQREDEMYYYFEADTEFGDKIYRVDKQTLQADWKSVEEPGGNWEHHGFILFEDTDGTHEYRI